MKALRRSHTSSSSSSAPSSPSPSWIHLRSLLVVSSSPVPDLGSLKSPWSRRKRKHALSRQQWNNFFMPDGKLRDGGVKFLKKVRSGGIDPSIRAEVWPFLLGVYELNSSEAERNVVRVQKRKEYKKLRRQCQQLSKHNETAEKWLKGIGEASNIDSSIYDEGPETPDSDYVLTPRHRPSLTLDRGIPDDSSVKKVHDEASPSTLHNFEEGTESSDSESSTEDDPDNIPMFSAVEETVPNYENIASPKVEVCKSNRTSEDFATWQRIIRLDAIRANAEWVTYSPALALVTDEKAFRSAEAVGLKDYDHLDPFRVHHAARLVSVLEAYAVYDPEIGYCQGMSELLSPMLAVLEDDDKAFWYFAGFMRKARHNFRLDEVGIRRQLNIVSRIIKSKDGHLYRHLEKLQAEDCFFVYRMVVVLFRRELSFEQTLCLWEVMWADQAAIRAGIGKSTWGRIRLRAVPPTDDLLLYAIAACVLQRRKLIIEKYSSMDEIMRECNSMAGQLDVWKLLDDAHDLVVTVHAKI